jgi:adenosyl cobinamide kinase/adenosyl cobinamide phosphate guanylyltransferase
MLNWEKIGFPLCEVKTTGIKKKGQVVYMASPEEIDEIHSGFTKYSLNIPKYKDMHFELSVNNTQERQIIYVTGSSGSGKSYWTRRYIESYKKVYPDRPIYLFSSINEDDSIDKIKDLQRINLYFGILNEDFQAEDFKDSCVIFDDCDTIIDTKLRKKVLQIQASILQTGRHFNVSAIITSHVSTNGADTKLILAEAHAIVFFVGSMATRSLKYLLESYMGMDKTEIKKIKNLPGRSVTFVKSFPKCVVSDKEVLILGKDD